VSSDTADFANRRFQNMILRHHENARQIVVHAVDELRIEPVLDRDDVQISDDWLNIFEREAVEMSSEQMQRLFGKVLAGELRKPGSYSIKTVRTLAQLDNRVAALFLLLSNLTSVLPAVDGSIEDARVICFGTKVKYGGLGLFGLDYDAVVLLQEHGLVIPEYDTGTSYSAAIIDMEIDQCRPFRLCGRRYTLAPHLGVDAARFTQFHVSGLQLTTVGRELLDIVTLNEEQGKDYMAYLEHHFKGIGVDMVLAD
jgi:hypothetical protein